MESPPILITKASNTQRRMSTSSQLFTRIDKNITSRKLKTSKLSRGLQDINYHNLRNQSLENSKQNMSYQKYLLKVKSTIKIDEKQMASNYLLNLRKQFDNWSKNIKQKTMNINVMKKQIDFMRDKGKNHRQNWDFLHDKLKVLVKQIDVVKIRQEQAVMQTKILDHIITRMKQDQLEHKTFANQKQLQLKQKKKQLKIKSDQTLHWDDNIHKIHQQMTKIKQQLKKYSQQRELKLQDYKNCVVDLQEKQKFQYERKQRTFQLLSIQTNDIMDAKNVMLRDVLMTNQVLDKLLEGKISDLLTHYQDLQNSYHLIKTQTNIADPQMLTKRFFSYNQTLEQITSTIRQLQQNQQQLLQANKLLKQKQKEIKIKQLEEQKISAFKLNEVEMQKQKLLQQFVQKQLLMKKINSWAEKMSQNIGLTVVRKSGENIRGLIQEICKNALKKNQQIKNQKTTTQKFQSPGVRLKKLIKQFSIEDQKIRRSEAQQINQSNIQQNAYLYYERKQIKKNQKNQFLIKIQQQKKSSTVNLPVNQPQKVKA